MSTTKASNRCALIAMYTHVEGYPPSLNAIQQLSDSFDRIVVVFRNTMVNTWPFPNNVELVTSREYTSYVEVKKRSGLWKMIAFLRFTLLFYRSLLKYKPEWVILHEPVALLAWGLCRKFYWTKHRIWYHNHDVIVGDESFLFRYAYKMQNRIFSTFDIFSLPADERRVRFPMTIFKGKYLHIPNYPGVYLYDKFFSSKEIGKQVKVVFQGHIGGGHGLEELVRLLGDKTFPVELTLVLKGFRDETFFNGLMKLAADLGVQEKVTYHGVSSYQSVPEIASACHIGVGIHSKTDIMNSTLGSASNKIYEYAALGLPVLLYDSEHFRKHLEKYEWAFFTDCKVKNIKAALIRILADYPRFSKAARADFLTSLNFERVFASAKDAIALRK